MPQTPVGFDFETFLIQPDFIAPPPVCLTLACRDVNFGDTSRTSTRGWRASSGTRSSACSRC